MSTIQKFNVMVPTQYEIEIDTDVWTPEAIKAWGETFSDAETPADIVRILAEQITQDGVCESNYEGFGHIQRSINYQGRISPVWDEHNPKYYPHIKVIAVHPDDLVSEVTEVTDSNSKEDA